MPLRPLGIRPGVARSMRPKRLETTASCAAAGLSCQQTNRSGRRSCAGPAAKSPFAPANCRDQRLAGLAASTNDPEAVRDLLAQRVIRGRRPRPPSTSRPFEVDPDVALEIGTQREGLGARPVDPARRPQGHGPIAQRCRHRQGQTAAQAERQRLAKPAGQAAAAACTLSFPWRRERAPTMASRRSIRVLLAIMPWREKTMTVVSSGIAAEQPSDRLIAGHVELAEAAVEHLALRLRDRTVNARAIPEPVPAAVQRAEHDDRRNRTAAAAARGRPRWSARCCRAGAGAARVAPPATVGHRPRD